MTAAAVGAMLLAAFAPGRAQAPPSAASSGRPDVLALVYQQPGQADLVDITYAQTVPHAQAQRDLAALAQAGGWATGPSRITDGSAPVQHKIPMTSCSFTAPGVVQNGTGTLPVEAFITAFRPYKRLALIFSVGPGFQFQGLRDYADNNVQIALEQRGTVYTYQVRIVNPQFTRLDLPRPQFTGAAAGTTARRASPWVLLLGILAAAGAAGVLVYVLMARKTPPPPRADSDALAEERTKIGTRG
jgi:hypothetical protein